MSVCQAFMNIANFSRLQDAFKIWIFWIPDRVTPEFGNDGATKSRARNKISRANNVHVR